METISRLAVPPLVWLPAEPQREKTGRGTRSARRGADRRWAWLVAGLALLLAAVMAVPLLQAPGERLIGHEIVGRHQDAYQAARWYETGPTVSNLKFEPATDWPGALLGRIVGGVSGYNLLILLTFPLTALATFLLARYLGCSNLCAALVGLVYAFAPFRLAHAAYHPSIVQTQWLPLYLLALWRCLDDWRPWRAAGLLAAGAVLALSNYYMAWFAVILTPVALIAYWTCHPHTEARCGRELRRTALTLGVAGALGVGYIALKAPGVLLRPGREATSFGDLFRYSAYWWSYLLPPVEHPILGAWARGFWTRHPIGDGLVEQQLSLGLAFLALAAIATLLWLRHRSEPALRPVPVLLLTGVVAFFCSLPPRPGALAAAFSPVELFHKIAPFFRAYARFGAIVQLCVLLLAALAVTRLLASGRRRQQILAFSLVGLGCFELAPLPLFRWHEVLPTEAHRWAARQEEPMRLLDCALPSLGEKTVRFFIPHPVVFPGGAVGDCGEPGLAAKLATLHITHVILRRDYYLADRVLATPGLRLVQEFPDADVLEVAARPATVFTRSQAGFSWRELAGERSYRWMGGSGWWVVVNASRTPMRARLSLGLSAFPEPRRLSLELNGQPLEELVVGTEVRRFETAPFDLPPGRSLLTFTPSGQPTVVNAVLHNGDRRALAVAVWDWSWSAEPATEDAPNSFPAPPVMAVQAALGPGGIEAAQAPGRILRQR